jgi:hypothetical protein
MKTDVTIVVLAAVAFLGTLGLSIRVVPRIAAATEGLALTWLVRGLLAGGVTIIALRMYEVGRAVHLALQNTTPGIDIPTTVTVQTAEALFEGGVLLALAAGLHLLSRLRDARGSSR